MAVQRWTDEMLDKLASTVADMRDSVVDVKDTVVQMRDSMTEMRDTVADVKDTVIQMRDSVADVKDTVDVLRLNTQVLLQVAEKHEREIEATKQKQAENDKRFYILLEEVRYLNRGKQAD